MSNQRETILNATFDLLENIQTSAGYNTNPVVERERQHFFDTVNFPALLLDEGEPEPIESWCFGQDWNTLVIQIVGRIRGTWLDLNKLVEDVRKILESSTNTYEKDTFITSVQEAADPQSDLKEFTMIVRIEYMTNYGSA